MNITVTARHFDLTPELKEYVEREINGLTRYFDKIISADVILDVEKYRQTAEVKIKVYRDVLTGTADSDDMYASIEMVIDKVKRQLKKYKGKLKEKRPDEINEVVEKVTRPSTNVDEVDL